MSAWAGGYYYCYVKCYHFTITTLQSIQTNEAPAAGIDGVSPEVLVLRFPFAGSNMSPVYK